MEMNQETKYKTWIVAILAMVAFLVLIKYLTGPAASLQKAIIIFPVTLLTIILLANIRPTRNVRQWAAAHKLTYFETVKNDTIYMRIRANPRKRFFTEDRFLHTGTSNSQPAPFSILKLLTETGVGDTTGPYVEGVVENRRVWFYPMFQKLTQLKSEPRFYGWCMEFDTHTIPLHVFVSKKFISKHDTHDTESNEFEQAYQVKADPGSPSLQLLDPAMMHLILESKISSIEFSDSSVVLTNITNVPSREALEQLLSWGLKIANQVDRNFPTSKR